MRFPSETEQRTAFKSSFGEGRNFWENLSYYIEDFFVPFDVRDKRMIDIGGGDGSVALFLRLYKGARVDVLDEYEGHGSDASNYDVLVDRCKKLGIDDLSVIRGDVRKVELPEEAYDHIVVRNCLHHIFRRKDPDAPDSAVVQFMEQMYRCVRPGGSLIIGEISWIALWRPIPLVNYYMHTVLPGCKRGKRIDYKRKSHYTRWAHCAQSAGFRFKRVDWYVPYRLKRWRPLLGNQLAGSCLISSYVLEVERPLKVV